MTAARALLLAALVAGAASPARAAPPPRERPAFESGADRALLLAGLPDVLSNAEVKPRLTSGLTTSFVFAVKASDAHGGQVKGGALVEVRYELWDEAFLVTATGADGRPHRDSLPSLDRLVTWWRHLKLPVSAPGRLAAGPYRVAVTLEVIPFSRNEQRETQSWLSRSVTEERVTPGRQGEPAQVAVEPVGGVLDLLVSTSIKRRSVVDFEWESDLQVAPEHRP